MCGTVLNGIKISIVKSCYVIESHDLLTQSTWEMKIYG
jgi:hypothetical protein